MEFIYPFEAKVIECIEFLLLLQILTVGIVTSVEVLCLLDFISSHKFKFYGVSLKF